MIPALLAAALFAPMSPSTAEGCTSLTPAAIGGALPPKPLIALRWLGTSNYEIAYGDQVVLLDVFYDRGPRYRPIGFTASQVKRADAILIGHAHSDHMSDVAPVAQQTHAKVIGAPITVEAAVTLGVPAAQTQAVRGGETIKLGPMTIEPILAQHSTLSPQALKAFGAAMDMVAGVPTAEQAKAEDAVYARGSEDAKIPTEGTLAYLITLDNGFRIIWRNSAGPITTAERTAMKRTGATDVAIIAYIGQYLAEQQIAVTLPIVQLYHPRLFLPAHHDEFPGVFPDIATEPILTAIRDQLPGSRGYAPLVREPICLDTSRR